MGRNFGPAGDAMDRLKLTPLARTLIRVLVVVAIAATLAATMRHITFNRVVEVLRSVDLIRLSVLVSLALTLGFLLRAARFRALLDSLNGRRAPLFDVLASVVLSQGANNVLPLRAGELVRTRDFVAWGLPLRRVAVAQVIEKIVEVATLLGWVLIVMSRPVPALLVAGSVASILGAWFFLAPSHGRKALGLIGRIIRVESLLKALGWSVLADGAEVALIAVCLGSLGIHASLPMSVAVLAGVNLAIALPSTPGHLGVFEAGAAVGLLFAGVSGEVAVSFALLYRIVQWVPVTLAAGILELVRDPMRRAQRSVTLQEGKQ